MTRLCTATLLTAVLWTAASPAPAADTIHNALGMEFVRIPAGEFLMGSADLEEIIIEQPDGDAAMIRDETPAHSVIIGTPFYLGTTEVTQAQWLAVMDSRPGPAEHWERRDWKQLPVVSVTWDDTQAFIKALNSHNETLRYRLPTEAEWEYAARAGTTGIRPFPEGDLVRHAWYINNSTDRIQPVATRAANPRGLHDMFGNVWEWVSDWYAPDTYATAARTDPAGPERGTKKIRRGGSFHCQAHLVRPAYRSADTPDTRYSVIGFRLVAIPGKVPGRYLDAM
jgi:formylglycine-generating enzyme required for sulfatase activity